MEFQEAKTSSVASNEIEKSPQYATAANENAQQIQEVRSRKSTSASDSSDFNLAETTYPTGLRFWLIITTIAVVLILGSLDINIVATAVPSITDHFHTVTDVGWYSSAFRLTACALQFIFGKGYKLFPIKWVFLLANALSLLGSLLSATATSSSMVVVGRAVAGMGYAGLLSGCFTILIHTMPLWKRPVFVGVLAGIESVAVIAGPLLGGALTQSLGWRFCFYINLPIGGLTVLLMAFCLPVNHDQKPSEVRSMTLRDKLYQLDLFSNLLFVSALTSLFIGLSWAGTKYPWSSGKIVGPLVTFAVLLCFFIANQFRKGDTAVLPPRILKQRSVIAGFIFIICTNSGIAVLENYLPIYYQVVRGYSPNKSGIMLLPIIIGAAIGTVLHGAGTSAFGYYAPFMLFSSITMPIAAGLITTFKINTSLAKLITYTAFSGFANGIGFSGAQTAVQRVLPKNDAPLGSSVLLFGQSFGPAVSVSIAQVILTNQLSANLFGLISESAANNIADYGLQGLVSQALPGKLVEVLQGVDKSIVQMFYLVVALVSVTIFGSILIEWRSVKPKPADTNPVA